MDFLSVIKESTKAVPAVRYALGIGGLLATIALIYTFKLDPRVAFVGLIVMFISMGVLLLFSRAASSSKSAFAIPSAIFTYFVLIMFMATSIALFSSVFFSKPIDLQYWLTGKPSAQALNLPDADSGWIDGGSSPDKYCNPIAAAYRQKYPGYNISVKPYPEQHRSEYNPFKHDLYRYTCSFTTDPK